jgi:DNA-binding MarR family transcriptional regulator
MGLMSPLKPIKPQRVGIMLQDAEGIIVSCNEEAEDILGLKRQAVLHLTSHDPRWAATDAKGRHLPGSRHPSMRTLKTGQPLKNIVMSVAKGFGIKPIWLKVDAEPIFSGKLSSHKPSGVLTLFYEIEAPSNLTQKTISPRSKRPEAIDIALKNAKKEAQITRRLSTTLSTYLINFLTHETLSFAPTGKMGALGYEVFLMLMQLYSINPSRPIPMKHILHGGHFSARRISDFLKALQKEGYIEVMQLQKGSSLSRERYLEVTSKLRRIFIQMTLDIQRLVEEVKEGGGEHDEP